MTAERDSNDDFDEMRSAMVEGIVLHAKLAQANIGRTALAAKVLAVMERVPRHVFVPEEIKPFAYLDRPLPIGSGKTISQPFIVALMTDLLDVEESDSVLEIGTGLGYQAAILAALARRVYTIEIVDDLATAAQHRFNQLGISNVAVRIANGTRGWIEKAPFEKIILTAAPELIPPFLLQQLKPGGRMVVPAGIRDDQKLMVVTKDKAGKLATKELLAVRFLELETEDED